MLCHLIAVYLAIRCGAEEATRASANGRIHSSGRDRGRKTQPDGLMKLESLEELRVFAQIVESGSLTAAAKALGMPANTVSRRLASLEERLGQRLLHRTTRSQSLSEAGRTMVVRAQQILGEVEAAEAALQREAEGLSGLVKLSVPSILAADMFRCIRALLAQNPGLRLQVAVNDRPVNPINEGLDVVIIGGTLSDSTLIARKLTEVKLVFVASEEYLDRYGEPRTPTELQGHQTVHFKTDPPQSSWVLNGPAGAQHVVPVEGRVEIADGRALIDAVRMGIGIGAMSMRVIRRTPGVRQILPDFYSMVIPVFAVYPASGQRSARLQALVAALQEAIDA